MPIHFAAMAAAAVGYATAQDCENHDTFTDKDEEELVVQTTLPDKPQSPASQSSLTSPTENRSVRFSEHPNSVRSMYSERNSFRHSEVRLRSVGSTQDEADEFFDSSLKGFLDGDFVAGKVKDIRLPSSCWVMAFSTSEPRAGVLAAGLKEQLDFYETRNYTCIYSLPRSDKVSAIQWCRGSALSNDSKSTQRSLSKASSSGLKGGSFDEGHGDIIAVGGMDGQVSVYHVSIPLLELKGVQLLHEFQVQGQVRCMALEDFGRGTLVLAVGDKKGKVTLSTLTRDGQGQAVETHRTVLDLEDDPVLGLDMRSERSILVVTTKAGRVLVYGLNGISRRQVKFGSIVWSTERNGPVRAVVISKDGKQLAFGGYDKSVVLVDMNLWAIVRELELQGTINTIAQDPLDRYLVVGCRDKSLTFYDSSTFFPVKRFQTPGWVTSISWGVPSLYSDLVAVRSENKRISLLDLTPIHLTDIRLPSLDGTESSVSWSPDGNYLAHVIGDEIQIADSRYSFCQVASMKIKGSSLRRVAFCPVTEPKDEGDSDGSFHMAAVGLNGYLHLIKFLAGDYDLKLIRSVFVEENLWVVSWSLDGKLIASGGRGKSVTVFSADNLLLKLHSVQLEGRIWDIEFMKHVPKNTEGEHNLSCGMAVATGDYKAIFYDPTTMKPTLQVVRPRTVRCLAYHPSRPLLGTGDGAGTVAIVDYVAEETATEFKVGGRVNVLEFSPMGDYLLIGTDDCNFTLHETTTFKAVQTFERTGFALTASFSPTGKYLAVGSSSEPYSIIRLGPLLGIELVPLTLKSGISHLPFWALQETLYRSGYGPSLLQRHMINGSQDNLQWVASTLKEHPDAIYAFDRYHGERCFETALRLRKLKLLKLAVTTLVDGSLDARHGGTRSILTTNIPEIGRKTLETMLENHPPEFIVEILKDMKFVKVPFTRPHVVSRDRRMHCASPLYLDPWVHYRNVDTPNEEDDKLNLTRTPAVLPLPGLGTMEFLSALVLKAPPTAFDNEAMGLVLRVMWQNHIRKYFIIDTIVFLVYFILWIVLVDSTSTSTTASSVNTAERVIAVVMIALNSVYAVKELVQSDLGRRSGYFLKMYNQVDILSILFVYAYSVSTAIHGGVSRGLVPLAVLTTLLLTVKLISYLRAFHDTGWLVTVLNQNFKDVRGFLVVLAAILVGFSVSFRLLFASNPPSCFAELDAETGGLVQTCGSNNFGSLRRSFLSTFELTILGSYDPSLLYDSQYPTLAIMTFIVAVTSVLVVALNALISVLADSYARVQENASANRRKEKAELIVEYMSLLPPWRRRKIERNTKYFHALLEADADGDLVIDDDDWRGGLNALRDDLKDITDKSTDAHQRAVEEMKSYLDEELTSFKKEALSMLKELSDDVKKIQLTQEEGGLTFNGKRVAGAVKAVREIGRKGSKFMMMNEKSEDS